MNALEGGRDRIFDDWIATHGGIVVRTARAFASGADRDDLEQEILLAIWRAVPAFRGGSSVATFLYRVAHNAALTWRRAERGRSARELRVSSELARSNAASAPEEAPDDDHLASAAPPHLIHRRCSRVGANRLGQGEQSQGRDASALRSPDMLYRT